jgi:hypothetical protein
MAKYQPRSSSYPLDPVPIGPSFQQVPHADTSIYKVMNTDFVGSIDVSVCELYMILSKYIHRSKAFFFSPTYLLLNCSAN